MSTRSQKTDIRMLGAAYQLCQPAARTMTVMEWVQDMAERWVRIMSASGDGSTPLDEAVRRLSPVGSSPSTKGGRISRRKTRAAAEAETSAVTTLCRQLIAGVLVSDLVIERLSVLESQSREQILDRMLASGLPPLPEKQLQVLETELSYSGAGRRDPQVPATPGWAAGSNSAPDRRAAGRDDYPGSPRGSCRHQIVGWYPAAMSSVRSQPVGLSSRRHASFVRRRVHSYRRSAHGEKSCCHD